MRASTGPRARSVTPSASIGARMGVVAASRMRLLIPQAREKPLRIRPCVAAATPTAPSNARSDVDSEAAAGAMPSIDTSCAPRSGESAPKRASGFCTTEAPMDTPPRPSCTSAVNKSAPLADGLDEGEKSWYDCNVSVTRQPPGRHAGPPMDENSSTSRGVRHGACPARCRGQVRAETS